MTAPIFIASTRLVFITPVEDVSSLELRGSVEKYSPSALIVVGSLANAGKANLMALRQFTAVLTTLPEDVSRNPVDGVHLEPLENVKAQRERFSALNVGVGGVSNRHSAMLVGEDGADYLGFGPIIDTWDGYRFEQALDLAAWWVDVMTSPCMIRVNSLAECEAALAADIDLLALAWTQASDIIALEDPKLTEK